jgi:hypothetical protein
MSGLVFSAGSATLLFLFIFLTQKPPHMIRKFYLLCMLLCALLLAADLPAAYAQRSHPKHRKARVHKTKSKTTPGQYPESSERLLTEKDMEHMTPWGLTVMENEIYARHGYVFRDADLRKHFRGEKWYKGKYRSMKSLKLTDTERQNISFIRRHKPKAKA